VTRQALIAACCLLAALSCGRTAEQQVPVVMHVHSTWSGDGAMTLPQIAEQAAARGIAAVILGDHALMEVTYGLPPFSRLIKKTRCEASVLQGNPATYIEEITAVNARYPTTLLIPGVEVAAHYFWTGSLLRNNLTVNNWHKHLLAAGIYSADVLRHMPQAGNCQARGSFRCLLLWPLLLCLSGLAVVLRKKYRVYGVLLLAAGSAGLVNNWPYCTLPAAAGAADTRPYQAVIDYVRHQAPETGIVFWNHPDAPNYDPPVRQGLISLSTPRYGRALIDTTDYTGFAYFQEGEKETGKPGGAWDTVLSAYCAGTRTHPVWAAAELDYRTEGHLGTYIDSYQNMVLLPDGAVRSPQSLLVAMKNGRFYALKKPADKPALLVDEFCAATRAGRAQAGERVPADGMTTITISLRMADQSTAPVTCTVISNAAVIATRTAATPATLTLRFPQPARSTYYRIEATTPSGAKTITNPLFVTVE
jgi:hypothetical protein